MNLFIFYTSFSVNWKISRHKKQMTVPAEWWLKRDKKIGSGSYGNIYTIRDDPFYVMKKIHCTGCEDFLFIQREIDCLKLLKGEPNVIQLLDDILIENRMVQGKCVKCGGECSSPDEPHHDIYLLLPRYDCDLNMYLDEREQDKAQRPFDLNERMNIFRQIARGLKSCHDKGVVHRDLKPPNILVGKKGDTDYPDIVLADFGLSFILNGIQSKQPINKRQKKQQIASYYSERVGTSNYRAIEFSMLHDEDVGKVQQNGSMDIWSLGCICFEIFDPRNRILFGGTVDAEIWRDMLCAVSNDLEQVERILSEKDARYFSKYNWGTIAKEFWRLISDDGPTGLRFLTIKHRIQSMKGILTTDQFKLWTTGMFAFEPNDRCLIDEILLVF